MIKAQACWIVGPKRAELRDHEVPAPKAGQALLQTLYTAISRGTETLVFEGAVPKSEWQRMRAPFQEGDFPSPVKYGYINVAKVLEGPSELIGKKVFSLYPHQTHFCVDASALTVLPDATPASRAVLAAGMETAINALWDASPQMGDRIAIVGAGVIGSLCGYLAAQIPGTEVVLWDVDPSRESIATQLGCRFQEARSAESVDPFDLVIHASGHGEGLQTALQIAGREAKIVEISWYGDREVSIPLGQAFHSQRLQIVGSQVGTIPAHQAARWSYKRRLRLALSLLQDARLDCLISGESDFAHLPQTLLQVTQTPGPLCHRIRY